MTVTETAARASLRRDAAFCIVVGSVVAVAAPALAEPIGLPVWSVLAAGLAAAAWGGWLRRLARSGGWVTAITLVAIANFVAGLGLAVFAITPGGARLRLFLGGLLSLAVLWFAVTQAIVRWNASVEP